MAKIATAFADNRGNLHPTAEAAVLADLTVILGRVGAESSLTAGLAQRIIEKRADIEAVFADLDAMTGGEHAQAA
ncbi:MAG: hypothetical protein NTX28_10100 [Novosphingobium sp.]|nr:hypothetical protein [Novosphingobium sp.]